MSAVVESVAGLVRLMRGATGTEHLRNYAAVLRAAALEHLDGAPPEVDGQMLGRHWSAAITAQVAEILEAVADERDGQAGSA